MSNDVFVTFFNENIFYTEKAAILKVYFRKSLISQLLLRIFQKKFEDTVVLTSSIHFWCQIPGNTSKSIQKNCKIWLFWHLHCQFPGKPEVIQQNGYDLRNQHPSISQKRIFWSLHFTKNLKIETCVIKPFLYTVLLLEQACANLVTSDAKFYKIQWKLNLIILIFV